MSISQVS